MRKRRKKTRSKVKFIFWGVLLLLLLSIFSFFRNINKTHSENTEQLSFVVELGETPTQISQRLEDQDLIHSRFWFELYSDFFKENKFVAGAHTVNPSMSIVDVAGSLTSRAESRDTKRVTLIEGWTFEDMSVYLENQGFFKQEEFIALAKKPDKRLVKKYPRLFSHLPEGNDLEGYLFPDTYEVFIDITAFEMMDKMLGNLDSKLSDGLYESIESSGRGFYETIIMASILEKEVRSRTEKKNVADIFYKRINDGMLLQADSTVNYITKKGSARSSYKDIEIDNPYNTYKYIGLTPGPITNPGIASIEAAIFPISNPYYFFLTSKSGDIYYGKNFEEHIYNRRFLDD